MKRALLLSGMTILTLIAAAWAALWGWFLLAAGLGPQGIWGVVEPGVTSTHPDGSVSFHRYHFHLLTGLVGAFLPLVLVGAFWVWRWARSSNG